MLLYFLIPCFSFFLFSKSPLLKPLPPWANETRLLLSLRFLKDLSIFSLINFVKTCFYDHDLSETPSQMSIKNSLIPSKVDNSIDAVVPMMPVMDLPELVIECILERLPPSGLCSMAGVCTSLRDKCLYIWEQKWSKVVGPAAHREWQWHVSSRNVKDGKHKLLMKLLSLVRPFSWTRSRVVDENSGSRSSSISRSRSIGKQRSTLMPASDSIMSLYLALETGSFWFPAQVYNRENGHVGFMLSCYDAELCYDLHTDTFKARYPPHGRRAIASENGLPWERVRASPVETPAHDLHVSDCLNELSPGDHIEIQWRRNKDFPYGWWYGVVGHLESCDGNENFCNCRLSDMVVLEFNQYTRGSRWRRTTVKRKDHREEGNGADGFYGGIRKLSNKVEISTWKQLWPPTTLE